MTSNDINTSATGGGPDAAVDKILDHHCLQLSALMDGELPPEQARFLLRRLEHDDTLRGCWERWQLAGDVMRGMDSVVVPGEFAGRVAAAIAAEGNGARAVSVSHPRWARWGGGAALAASVAVVAMFLVRQSPEVASPAAPAPATVAISDPAPIKPVAPAPAPSAPAAPDRAAQLATAVAVADAPRKVLARRSRGQSQRAALRSGTRASIEAPIAVASATPPVNATAVDPFSGQAVSLPDRPWPRALLPGSPASGAFTVDYGNRVGEGTAALHPFYPFVPRAAAVSTPADEADRQPQR
jgi:negative regulator of sigma E activity